MLNKLLIPKGIALMDESVYDFFSEASDDIHRGNFYRVLDLSEDLDIASEDLCASVQGLCKGWVELARLPAEDRVEFTKEYWLSKFPFHPRMVEAFDTFFSLVEDIGIFVVQKQKQSPLVPKLVYSLKGERGFFQGSPGISEESIEELRMSFSDHPLPDDYLAFLRIHNGFSKSTDTGLVPAEKLPEKYEELQQIIENEGPLLIGRNQVVDPSTLLPFYQSFGMAVYQCFWTDWYPQNEMGNVYYSALTHSLSDIDGQDLSTESLAFPTFADWLFFYLEIFMD